MAKPIQQNKVKATDRFNIEFTRFLRQVGWTNSDTVNEFVAKVDSIALTARGIEAQKLILRYLDKGLDLLNMEMQKVELDDNKRISQVSAEDVADMNQPSVKVESAKTRKKTLKECDCDTPKKDPSKAKQIKLMLDEFMESLATVQIGNGKTAKDLINVSIQKGDGTIEPHKKVLKDVMTEADDAKEGNKKAPNTEPAKKTKGSNPEPKKPKVVNLEPKKKTDQKPEPKQPTKEPKKKAEPKKDKSIDSGNVQPMINNFQIFLRNFFINEAKVSDEISEIAVSTIQKIVDRSAEDLSKQSAVNASLSDSFGRMKSLGTPNEDFPKSKNIQVSMKEISNYGTLFKGWSPDQMSRFVDKAKDLLSLIGTPKLQRAVVGEFQRALQKTK